MACSGGCVSIATARLRPWHSALVLMPTPCRLPGMCTWVGPTREFEWRHAAPVLLLHGDETVHGPECRRFGEQCTGAANL